MSFPQACWKGCTLNPRSTKLTIINYEAGINSRLDAAELAQEAEHQLARRTDARRGELYELQRSS